MNRPYGAEWALVLLVAAFLAFVLYGLVAG